MRSLVTSVAALLLGFFGTLLARLLSNEALGLLSKLSRHLVERAVKRLPEEMREQYRDEWLATLEYEGRDGKKLSELKAALEAWQSADATATAHTPELDPSRRAEIERTIYLLLVRPLVVAGLYDFVVFGLLKAEPTLLSMSPYLLIIVWVSISAVRGHRYISKLQR